MALATLIGILVDGSFVPSVPPAALVGGRAVGPPSLVAQFADRVDVTPDGVVTAERGRVRCAQRPVDSSDPPMIALAPLARCLGATVGWDARTKTLSIAFERPAGVTTMPPYDPNAPRVAPTTVFTPEPRPPTPRAIATGEPRPRRTAIPVVPSWPVPAATTPSR